MNEMKKITVLETIPEQSGFVCCCGRVEPYDAGGNFGDVAFVLKGLIEMGAIPSEMVDFYTAEEAVQKLNEMG